MDQTPANETPPAAFNPEAFGITEETIAMLEANAAETAASKTPKPRATMLDGPKAFFAGGKDPIRAINAKNVDGARLMIASEQNKHAQNHADRMFGLWKEAALEKVDATIAMGGLAAYFIGGTNTYAKALRSYRSTLMTDLAARFAIALQDAPDVKAKAPAKEGKPAKAKAAPKAKPVEAKAPKAPKAPKKAAPAPAPAPEPEAPAAPAPVPHGNDIDDAPPPAPKAKAAEPEAEAYKTKAAATHAAQVQLGMDAKAGLDFDVINDGQGNYSWKQMV